jgi:ABC-2 type transport system permease protein
MHNLGTVFRFEVVRTLKRKSFWLVSLLLPAAIAAVGSVAYFSNQATKEASQDAAKQHFSFQVLDQSRQVKPAIVIALGGQMVTSKEAGVDNVENGKVDAFFYYPTDLASAKVEVYGKDVGLFNNDRYSTVARLLLSQSVTTTVAPNVSTVLSGQVGVTSTTYRNGSPYDGMQELIAPAIFLVLFYFMIVTFGNQMLNATTEEKENRVIEMILTTIESRTLVVGKILSLIVLGFLQVFIVLIPVLIGYLIFHDKLSLPSLDVSHLVFNWPRIGVGFLLFTASFVLFTGLLVGIGAAAPTAKEAGSFFGVVILLLIGPVYAASLFISSPDAGIVQFLSYFPFTAPIPLMLRNAVGNLENWQAGIALVILVITATVVMATAIRTFRYGALEYSRRLTLKEIFRR